MIKVKVLVELDISLVEEFPGSGVERNIAELGDKDEVEADMREVARGAVAEALDFVQEERGYWYSWKEPTELNLVSVQLVE